jgi:repressor LexA
MSVVQRIKQYIDFKDITNQKFETEIGYSNGGFGSQLRGNKTIGSDKLENILKTYPDLNPNWLLTGTGPMLKKEEKEIDSFSASNSVIQKPSPLSNGVPLIPMDAFAGIGDNSVFGVDLNTIEERYVVPLFDGLKVDFMISVRGVSMSPTFLSGDVVACRLIRDFHYIQTNHVYVIDTLSQGIIMKRIIKSKDTVTCRSDNQEYDDLTIPMTEIRSIAQVIGCIRVE